MSAWTGEAEAEADADGVTAVVVGDAGGSEAVGVGAGVAQALSEVKSAAIAATAVSFKTLRIRFPFGGRAMNQSTMSTLAGWGFVDR
jgi:hypothetical protein